MREGGRLLKERIYSLTEKGVARFEWLESKGDIFYADFVGMEGRDQVFIPIWR